MTYRRTFSAQYVEDLSRLGDEWLRTRVRSTTTLLAGNPYLPGSEAVEGAVRVVGVEGVVHVVYEISHLATLSFLAVRFSSGSEWMVDLARRMLARRT